MPGWVKLMRCYNASIVTHTILLPDTHGNPAIKGKQEIHFMLIILLHLVTELSSFLQKEKGVIGHSVSQWTKSVMHIHPSYIIVLNGTRHL